MKTFWLALRARCANKIREMASRKFLLSGDHMGVTTAISCYFPLFSPAICGVCESFYISVVSITIVSDIKVIHILLAT